MTGDLQILMKLQKRQFANEANIKEIYKGRNDQRSYVRYKRSKGGADHES